MSRLRSGRRRGGVAAVACCAAAMILPSSAASATWTPIDACSILVSGGYRGCTAWIAYAYDRIQLKAHATSSFSLPYKWIQRNDNTGTAVWVSPLINNTAWMNTASVLYAQAVTASIYIDDQNANSSASGVYQFNFRIP